MYLFVEVKSKKCISGICCYYFWNSICSSLLKSPIQLTLQKTLFDASPKLINFFPESVEIYFFQQLYIKDIPSIQIYFPLKQKVTAKMTFLNRYIAIYRSILPFLPLPTPYLEKKIPLVKVLTQKILLKKSKFSQNFVLSKNVGLFCV